MLKLIGITKSFGDRIILKEAFLLAQAGQITALTGKNGAGKSTLFGIITGTIAGDGGQILLGEQDLTNINPHTRSLAMAILKQDPKTSTVPSLTVMENLSLALLKGQNATLKNALSVHIKHNILNHIRDLGLDENLLDRHMSELSGGQRQVLAFAMATIRRPQLLLLDEPTAALDEGASIMLMKLIKHLVREWHIPALMICHDKELVTQFADAVYMLDKGRVNLVEQK